jgi:hypothetical protein
MDPVKRKVPCVIFQSLSREAILFQANFPDPLERPKAEFDGTGATLWNIAQWNDS